jgi:phosphopantetheine--protein transferase-like protein
MASRRNNLSAIGIDVVEIKRIRKILKSKAKHKARTFFTKLEMLYYRSYKEQAPHLAGIFAAKEAVSKALGVNNYPFIEIEIRHNKYGAPVAYHNNKKLRIIVSITHTKDIAIAVAVA